MILNPRQFAEQLTERARKLLRRKHDYAACFQNPDGTLTDAGAAVMADIARFAGAYKTTAAVSVRNGRIDPLSMAKQEGRREVYLYLLGQLRLKDETILNAMENANER